MQTTLEGREPDGEPGSEASEPKSAVGTPCGGVPPRVPDPPVEPAPPFYKVWWRWWLTKAVVIGAKQNRGLSWLAYYVGLGPVAWMMRKQGSDRLDRATRPVGPSGWKPREQPIAVDPDRIRRPV